MPIYFLMPIHYQIPGATDLKSIDLSLLNDYVLGLTIDQDVRRSREVASLSQVDQQRESLSHE